MRYCGIEEYFTRISIYFGNSNLKLRYCGILKLMFEPHHLYYICAAACPVCQVAVNKFKTFWQVVNRHLQCIPSSVFFNCLQTRTHSFDL